MVFKKTTEQESNYRYIDKMSIAEILHHINTEDKTIANAVSAALLQIEKLTTIVSNALKNEGRLFYIGAGTSGRLGILDASEIPPTYGLPQGIITGIIAGGKEAIQKPVENAEDDETQGWKDLQQYSVTDKDVVIGIAASGTTPYVIGAITKSREKGIATGCITCNVGSPLAAAAQYPVEVVTGPEFVTGSTRMKSGTAQKMVLNMISTTAMIQMGRVDDNKMVNMQLTNEKLVDRGTKMLMEKLKITDYEKAKEILLLHGSVKKAIDAMKYQD